MEGERPFQNAKRTMHSARGVAVIFENLRPQFGLPSTLHRILGALFRSLPARPARYTTFIVLLHSL